MGIPIAKSDIASDVIRGCKSGERWAQKTIYEYYYPKMIGTSLRYSNNRDQAKDILHEAFIKVFNNFEKYNTSRSLDTWIRRIVVNTAIDQFRKNKTRRDAPDYKIEPLHHHQVGAESQAAEQEILACVQALPNKMRVIFNLYVMEGYQHEEIANLLEIKASTSRSALVKARRNLRKMLIEKGLYDE
ncbi:MAG: sigma-70 family RNA polymerase sigma factor [Bacteroidetes bacterium]|jgi:RNA polymerase sigma-70 factor (ECF subfamily)|nr:sigma-70 family RNA polymerase sigma factor [Bacteroidota bacterium]